MNSGTVTGGVVKEATSAQTPSTKEQPSIRRVLFSISVRDHFKGDSFWNCEAEGDDELMDFLLRHAVPGAGIKVDYELSGRPFYKGAGKHQYHAGEVRFLRVFAAEINGQRVPAQLVGVPA